MHMPQLYVSIRVSTFIVFTIFLFTSFFFCYFVSDFLGVMLYVLVNNFSLLSGRFSVLLDCLAQTQHSTFGESQSRDPSISSSILDQMNSPEPIYLK